MATTILTTTQVAARLGIHPSRVRRLAEHHQIGTKLGPRAWAFTEQEVAMLARHSTGVPGRPFAKTRRLASILSDTDWMDALDPDAAGCRLTRAGEPVADGAVALRDGAPVVLVDDDARTILTADELRARRLTVAVRLPAPLTAYGADLDRAVAAHGRRLAAIGERASRLALAGVPVGYDLTGARSDQMN